MAPKLSMKRALVFSISFYFFCRLKIHFSLGLSAVNKNSLFLLVNFIVLLMIIIYNFSGNFDIDATATCDIFEELEEELAPLQSQATIIEETMSNDSLYNDEYFEDKSIILVEKYAKEEEHGEEEEIMLGIFLNKDVDTGWRRDLIRESSSCPELVAVKYFVPEVKKIVSFGHELDKLDLNAANRKFDEFIGIQKRTWAHGNWMQESSL